MINHKFEWNSPLYLRNALVLILVTFFVRLGPASMVYGTVDVDTWQRWADSMMMGSKFYVYNHVFIDWPPLILWICYFIQLLSNLTGIAFTTLIKLPPIFSDCFIAVVIYAAVLRSGVSEKVAMTSGFFYALHPISILVSSVHGQYDSFVILFCLLSWFFFEFKEGRKAVYLSGISLGIGLLLKGYAIILLPLFLLKLQTRKERLIYTLITISPVIVSFIPYLITTPGPIIKNVLGYSSRAGDWGYTLVLAILHNHLPLRSIEWLQESAKLYGKFLLLIALLLFYWYSASKKLNLLESFVLIFALFYALTHGFGRQYLVWIVPFAILYREFPLKQYTIFATLWLLTYYFQIISDFFYNVVINIVGNIFFWRMAVIFSLLTWGVCLIWLFKRFRADFSQ